VPAFGGGERGPRLGPCAEGGLAHAGKNGSGMFRKNINLLIDALSPYKEVKPRTTLWKIILNCCNQMSYCKDKTHQSRFPLGLCPRPHWGDHSAPPNLLAAFLVGGEGKGMSREGKGREGKGGEGKGEAGRKRKGGEGLAYSRCLGPRKK